jgi:WD40 repeat protein
MNTGLINTFNITTLSMITGPVLTGHTAILNRIVQINANQVASASDDATIRVWNTATNTLVNTYYGHSVSVTAVCVLSNGNLLSGGGDNTLRMWNMQAQTVSTVVASLPAVVSDMALSPVDGSLVVIVPNSILFYNPTSWALISSYSTGVTYFKIIVMPWNGNVLAANIIWEVWNPSGSKVFSQQWDAHSTIDVILLPDNVTVVGCRTSGNLETFNAVTNTVGTTFAGHTQWATSLSLTPDKVLIVSAGWDNLLMIWTWTTMSLTKIKTYSATVNTYIITYIGTLKSGMFCF